MKYVRFRGRELELNESNFGFFHSCRSSRAFHYVLGQYESINHVRIIYCAANFLDETNVVQINVNCFCWIDDANHRIDSNWSEQRRVLRNNLTT